MTPLELLARCDKYVRPFASRYLPPSLTVSVYSKTRPLYLKNLIRDIPQATHVSDVLATTLWGIRFRSPLLNAAGMFKNGEGYQFCAAQGAGAYIAGTTTGPARRGNTRSGVYLPFAPYPCSLSSSNWLGLPNDGDAAVAARLGAAVRVQDCPIGASIMGSPDLEGEAKLEALVSGMKAYERAGVDFIEMNESCPNTEDGRPQESDMFERLRVIKSEFLDCRVRRLPVLVKFSLDTDVSQLADLTELLVELGFDGLTLGNTSTQYERHRAKVVEDERKLFDYFTSTFGGGLGGEVVRDDALRLVKAASEARARRSDTQEFHIVRTGGVSSARDVYESIKAGASLVQWYTGYFEAFAAHGHDVYEQLYAELLRLYAEE